MAIVSGPDSGDIDFGYYQEGQDSTSAGPIYLRALADVESIAVSWETATAMGLLGFNVSRSESALGSWTQINASLMPAQVPGTPMGADYVWNDTDVEIDTRYN